MFSQGAADVPCTLLHFVNNELVDVAKGKIVQPGNPLFHGTQMPPNLFRVQLVRVLPGCDELLPPIRPVGADDDDVMTLSACLIGWPLLWPKSQIRLGAGDTTPKTTPPVVPAPSRPHGKTAATVPEIPMPLIQTCIWHRIRTTTTTIHLPTSIGTLPIMGTMATS